MTSRVNLLTPEVRASPYPYYAEMRRQSPVCQVDPGGMWAVTRYDDVQAVLKNPKVFSSEAFRTMFHPPWLETSHVANSIGFQDPPRHTRLRNLVNRAFTPAAMARLEPGLRQVADGFATELLSRRHVNFTEAFSVPIPAAAVCQLLGLDPSLRGQFKRWADDVASISAIGAEDHERQQAIRTTMAESEHFMNEVLEERRRSPGDDMLSALLRVQEGSDVLSNDEVKDFFFALLIGGLESTANLFSLSAFVLLNHPEIEAQVRADLSLLPRFIEEVLRYEPPVHAVMRFAKEDTTVGDFPIAGGTPLLLLLASANRDESRFPDADRFDLDRPANQHVSFGHGIHYCLGGALARLEAKVALEVLLSRCRLAPGKEPMQWNYSMVVRGPQVLPVEVHPA